GGEEPPRGLEAAHEVLGVPLHPHHEAGVVVELHALYELIGRPRHRLQPVAERLDHLMMEAVDLDVIDAEHLGEAAAGSAADLVCRLSARRLLAVLDLRAGLRATSWWRVPPSATLSTWMPRQMARSGVFFSSAMCVTDVSSASRDGATS